ncbi:MULTISPECIES: DUF4164 domain-containing protein [unclassified Roseitalea]|uniref:DUF4164 domain-containing protein n=1 Tax=unclassified Roseitalea TaxID=2639107 RepID=UPI00273EAC4B|nr:MULTISPECIES: DUF4164 domain-containing protein [unclassified Roseitalea]
MSGSPTLTELFDRLDQALAALDDAVERTAELRREYADAEEEAQRLNSDRARLAEELDKAEARAERLEEVNKEVSRRLVTAMETIRAVLDH